MRWRSLCSLPLCRTITQSFKYINHLASAYSTLPAGDDLSLKWTSRTHWCGKLRAQNVGERVRVNGWVQFLRLDNKFILLRDATGVIQLTIPQDGDIGKNAQEKIKRVGPESSLRAIGTVRLRPEGQSNPKMPTGTVEVDVESIESVNPAVKSLPFLPSRVTNESKEPLRMKYRSLDLRRNDLQSNLRLRSKVVMKIRQFLCDHGFQDIETPTLFRKTPGGAREFIVPTRNVGKFYSLVQSPQQFKQMLMVAGFDKYFQIARCYRDEGAKPDRQPEFTQVDIEMAWTDRTGVQDCIEALLRNCWPEHLNFPPALTKKPGLCFPRKTYRECIDRYGTDKPDLRFSNEILDWTELFQNNADAEFSQKINLQNCCVKAVVFPQETKNEVSSADIKRLEKQALEHAKPLGGDDTLMVSNFKVEGNGDIKCSLLKRFAPDLMNKLKNSTDMKANDLGFIVVGTNIHDSTSICAGKLRTELSKLLYELDPMDFRFLWVEDFPMFLPKENMTPNYNGNEVKIESAHHPFTAPHPDDEHLLTVESDNLSADQLLKIRSLHYDLVLNGQEIGGGSIRIHNPTLQKMILQQILGEDISELKHLLDSLSFGCPPHGGIALGLDRLIAILCNAPSIRDVIAFPKGGEGKDAMSNAPADISKEEQIIYHINVVDDDKGQ